MPTFWRVIVASIIAINCFFSLQIKAYSYTAISKGNCKVDIPIVMQGILTTVKGYPTIPGRIGVSCDVKASQVSNNQQVGYCFRVTAIPAAGQYSGTRKMYLDGNFGLFAKEIYFDFRSQLYNSGPYVRVGSNNENSNIYGYAYADNSDAKASNVTYAMRAPMQIYVTGSNQSNVREGNYTYGLRGALYGGNLELKMGVLNSNEDPSAVCRSLSSGITAPSNVRVDFNTSCQVETSGNFNFKSYTNLNNVDPVSVNVRSNCSQGTKYSVTIDNGNHYSINGQRRMSYNDNDSGPYIDYDIDTTSWEGTGSPSPLIKKVTASVPQQSTPQGGIYKDQLRVNMTIIAK